MTKTARDLRSAAHALRTAANALEETVTALRALSDDLNEPEPAPEPVWPTAPLVWHDGKVWVQAAAETYFGDSSFWGKYHLNSETAAIREGARRFAREAIPVTPVPTEAWEEWGSFSLPNDQDAALMDAVDSLAQEVIPVPAAEWEAWRKAAGRREWSRTEADLIRATDALTGGER